VPLSIVVVWRKSQVSRACSADRRKPLNADPLGSDALGASRNSFQLACVDAFRPLVDDFDFDEPEVESIGRESYVRFHKGSRTVSVACEHGLTPIVELFYPSAETGEPPVPWASRDGIPYARRIPRLGVRAAVPDGSRDAYSTLLTAILLALVDAEREFLSGCGS